MLKIGKRRYGLLVFVVLLVLCVTACGETKQQGTPVEISYLNKSETKIVPEVHYLQGTSTKEMIVEVLTLLSAVPDNKELEATLPGGISIVNYAYEKTQVTVALGEKYKELAKTSEVLTRAAIVRSLTSIPEVNYVMLTINGEPLLDTMGNPVGIMTADMFIDYAGQKITDSYGQAKIRLYFANETGIPVHLLTGATEDECKAQAEAIKAYAQPSGYPKVKDGGEMPKPNGSTKQQFADFMGQILN